MISVRLLRSYRQIGFQGQVDRRPVDSVGTAAWHSFAEDWYSGTDDCLDIKAESLRDLATVVESDSYPRSRNYGE
jgi:hypothetical protein